MPNDFSSQPGAQGPVKSGRGRSDSGSGETSPSSGTYETSTCCSSRQGTVVIRATVEHIGVAGDTEMTVTVKWPASTFCVQPIEPCSAPGGPGPKTPRVPANGPLGHNFDPGTLYGRLEQDIPPAGEEGTATLAAEKGTATPPDECGSPS
jgi:hypothetical protein